MAEQIKREETAFPYAEIDGYGGVIIQHLGMTLRDYFATHSSKEEVNYSTNQLLKLMGVETIPTGIIENMKFWMEVDAKIKYMRADAMLKARENE